MTPIIMAIIMATTGTCEYVWQHAVLDPTPTTICHGTRTNDAIRTTTTWSWRYHRSMGTNGGNDDGKGSGDTPTQGTYSMFGEIGGIRQR